MSKKLFPQFSKFAGHSPGKLAVLVLFILQVRAIFSRSYQRNWITLGIEISMLAHDRVNGGIASFVYNKNRTSFLKIIEPSIRTVLQKVN